MKKILQIFLIVLFIGQIAIPAAQSKEFNVWRMFFGNQFGLHDESDKEESSNSSVTTTNEDDTEESSDSNNFGQNQSKVTPKKLPETGQPGMLSKIIQSARRLTSFTSMAYYPLLTSTKTPSDSLYRFSIPRNLASLDRQVVSLAIGTLHDVSSRDQIQLAEILKIISLQAFVAAIRSDGLATKGADIFSSFRNIATFENRAMSGVSSREVEAIRSETYKELLVSPQARQLFYPVTGASLIESERKQALVLFGDIALTQSMEVMPAQASDSLLQDAVSLIQSMETSSQMVRVDLFIKRIKEGSTFKTGEINEITTLAHLDLLHRLVMILLSNYVSDVADALDQIGKKPSDLFAPDFYSGQLVLYKNAKPDAYKVLKNNKESINIILRLMQAENYLLQLLADNFNTLQSTSKRLALQASIALQQTQSLLESPSLLGGMVSPLLIPDSKESKIGGQLVAHAMNLPKKFDQEPVLRDMDIPILVLLIDALDSARQIALLQLVQNENKDRKQLYKKFVDELNQKDVAALQKLKNIIEEKPTSNTPALLKQIEDANIYGQSKFSNQVLEKLTQNFMNEVSQKASGWLLELTNKKGMISFAEVAKVVRDKVYDNDQILYIQGYLQSKVGL